MWNKEEADAFVSAVTQCYPDVKEQMAKEFIFDPASDAFNSITDTSIRNIMIFGMLLLNLPLRKPINLLF